MAIFDRGITPSAQLPEQQEEPIRTEQEGKENISVAEHGTSQGEKERQKEDEERLVQWSVF